MENVIFEKTMNNETITVYNERDKIWNVMQHRTFFITSHLKLRLSLIWPNFLWRFLLSLLSRKLAFLRRYG